MTGTPAERAALLSARIHREINAGASLVSAVQLCGADCDEFDYSVLVSGTHCVDDEIDRALRSAESFLRLGAEQRAIVLGNREGRR